MSREVQELRDQLDEVRRQLSAIPVRYSASGGAAPATTQIGLCIITSIEEGDDPEQFSMDGRLVRVSDIDAGEYEDYGDAITLRPVPGATAQNYLPYITPPTPTFYFSVGGHKFVPMLMPFAPLWPEPTNTESSEC